MIGPENLLIAKLEHAQNGQEQGHNEKHIGILGCATILREDPRGAEKGCRPRELMIHNHEQRAQGRVGRESGEQLNAYEQRHCVIYWL